ncbi:MAG TPA: NAD(P)H-hydrate dehydratase [Pyrinomonadaceae bacterium]|nr:NAD(P)H-hydrate dehydratase [Pyrinomonadaceae bacterium]
MQPVLSSSQMREIDRVTERYGIPSLVLMENAAAATARVIAASFPSDIANRSVLVLCGRGNNGGDGAAAARLLAHAGANVTAILFGNIADTKGDARTNFEALTSLAGDSSAAKGVVRLIECTSDNDYQSSVNERLSESPDVIVDALFGTGLTRPLQGVHAETVRRVNALRNFASTNPLVVSIDVPSGLNADSPEPIGEAVQADLTVTMTAPKIANVLPPASNYNGRLIVADIGSPAEFISKAATDLFLTEETDARRWLVETRYTPDSYKNTHGHAIIVAGARGFTGAAGLCANAAMNAGAGLVTVATPASAQPLVATQVMAEVMTAALAETDRGAVSDDASGFFSKFSEKADVIAIGPGLSSEDDRTRKFVRRVVENRRTPVVVDADGLNCLSPWPGDLRGSAELPIVLTPHPGEMLRLMGTSDKSALNDRIAAARKLATQHEVVLLLKGGRSLVAAPDGRVFLNSTGNAGLGTAGAGDTLTGVVAGFLAQAKSSERVSALDTVIAALYVSGLAGDLAARELGMRCMVASDIREHLSAAVCSIDPRGEQPR